MGTASWTRANAADNTDNYQGRSSAKQAQPHLLLLANSRQYLPKLQLKFYYKYVAELMESDDNDEDDVDGRVFGNIFHCAAQLMYERLLPREVITRENIEYVLKTGKSSQSPTTGNANATMSDIVSEAFARELFLQKPGSTKHPKLNGLQLINQEVIEKFLRQLLRIDLRTAPLRVIGHESMFISP